jgi:hypothetical protein
VLLGVPGFLNAQVSNQTSSDQFLLAPRDVNGKMVGPKSCLMQEIDMKFEGRTFRRIDIGLSGTVDGYVTKGGIYSDYLTNAPDLVFPQTMDFGRRYLAISTYHKDKGAAMTIIYPLNKSEWNQKMYVMAHGMGRGFVTGGLKAWDKYLNSADPLDDLTKYDKLILSKGYVLVKTYRSSYANGNLGGGLSGMAAYKNQHPGAVGEVMTELEDGTTTDTIAFNDTARYVMDFADVARKPVRTSGEA